MLPLRFIKASENVALCATRIVAIMSTDSLQARNSIKEEKRAGTLINAAGRMPVKTAIFLDNGTVIASPLSITRLMNAIEKSNYKSANTTSAKEPVRLTVYDVKDESPSDEFLEDIDDVLSNLELEPDEEDTQVE